MGGELEKWNEAFSDYLHYTNTSGMAFGARCCTLDQSESS
jgi:hypothetical protein